MVMADLFIDVVVPVACVVAATLMVVGAFWGVGDERV